LFTINFKDYLIFSNSQLYLTLSGGIFHIDHKKKKEEFLKIQQKFSLKKEK